MFELFPENRLYTSLANHSPVQSIQLDFRHRLERERERRNHHNYYIETHPLIIINKKLNIKQKPFEFTLFSRKRHKEVKKKFILLKT